MNETIGAKGGHNDILRTNKLKKNKKKKIEKLIDEELEIKGLEKSVRKRNLLNILMFMPLSIIGEISHVLTEKPLNKNKLKEEIRKDIDFINTYSIEEQEKILEQLQHIKTKEDYIKIKKQLDKNLINKIEDKINNNKDIIENILIDKGYNINLFEKEKEEIKTNNKAENILETNLRRIKTHKLADTYEKKLKEIRYDINELSYEYFLLEKISNEIYKKEEADKVLNKINKTINRIDELKYKLDRNDIKNYDDNYLYVLIEDYLDDFKNGITHEEIDSELFILLEEKIKELENKKDKLKDKVSKRKEELNIDDIKFNEIKNKYNDLKEFNKNLLEFQHLQDKVLDTINDKLRNAISIEERVKVKIDGANYLYMKMFASLSLNMFTPGVRGATKLTAATLIYKHYMEEIMSRKEVNKYKVYKVKDYSNDIEYSINNINNSMYDIKRAIKELNKVKKDIYNNFNEYLYVFPECNELLNDLNRLESNLDQKEYELNVLKKHEELNLEKNNNLVKKLDNKNIIM